MVAGSSGNSRQSSTPITKKTLDAKAQASSCLVFSRIGSNLLAGALLLVSLCTLAVLLTQGLFDRQVIITSAQTPEYWTLYDQTCRLTTRGFVKNSCSEMEANTTTPAAWRKLGTLLGISWLPRQSWYVTTCLVGPHHKGWVYLIFLASETSFPSCVPENGPQLIDGMAMLTTTNANDAALSVYELTLYGDSTDQSTVTTHANSDGTTVTLFANTTQFLVATNGTVAASQWGGGTSMIISEPLGSRYVVETRDGTYFVDRTADPPATPGWSVGRVNGKIIVIATAAESIVANFMDIAIYQGVVSALCLVFLSGDVVMTWRGLAGVWRRQPVLTYDLLLGLEQRKLVLLLWALNALPSLLYVDIARVYYGTANGNLIWLLSLVMLGNLTAFVTLLGVTFIQYIPSPFAYVVPFSTPVFLFSTILGVLLDCNRSYAVVSSAFLSGAGNLALNINGTERTAGALLLPSMVVPTAISFAVAVVYALVKRYWACRQWLVPVEWASRNSFLKTRRLPNYISSLPLGPETSIRIGNKAFVKPSALAVMGYSSVVESADGRHSLFSRLSVSVVPSSTKHAVEACVTIIVSSYSLVPVLWGWLRPRPVGAIVGNAFVHSKIAAPAVGKGIFVYSRGSDNGTKTLDARAQAPTRQVAARIGSNLLATGLIFLSIATLFLMLNGGLFTRHDVVDLPQTASALWGAYGQSCRLRDDGFVHGSCSTMEYTTTTPDAWNEIGRLLGTVMSIPTSTNPWFVSTCTTGPPGISWVFVTFLVSATEFPPCIPVNGGFMVDGIATLGTTNDDAFATGVYQLVMLPDTAMSLSASKLNTDGTSDVLFTNISAFLIAGNGSSYVDPKRINTHMQSAPISSGSTISTYSVSGFSDVSDNIDEIDSPGWVVGRTTGRAVVVNYETILEVGSYNVISAVQGMLGLLSLALLGGDAIMTLKGLEGALLRKPVLTYDLMSGLERRKLLLLLLTMNSVPALLYLDVAVAFYGTASAPRIWFLSSVMIGNLASYATLLAVALLQYLPAHYSSVIPFSAGTFVYLNTLSIALLMNDQYDNVGHAYYCGGWTLPLSINGSSRPAGACATSLLRSSVAHLFPQIVYPTALSFIASIAFAMSQRYFYLGQVLRTCVQKHLENIVFVVDRIDRVD
ncbi:hypothetical protein ACHHYP_16811 [Achlya hypogyna]|uniref:Transmembrane protein n=1 Tax=Achlya hypogyna TaxID=1202772 RepID=A0A1V9Y5Q4_ACHHY|nr:hypothetical protein ACHHYP_16811 [Achlya hypogyna]